jgi:hypothetical protein
LTSPEQHGLYFDYKNAFDLIHEIPSSSELSEDGVSFNGITSMFLCMCFHDNSIDATQQDFRQYISAAIDPITGQWIAESRYTKTLGADASSLFCPKEQFASRVLRTVPKELKHNNGCNAATIYLTDHDPKVSLSANPFTFGCKDACHVNKDNGKKTPLCGPSEVLPRVTLTAPPVAECRHVCSWV